MQIELPQKENLLEGENVYLHCIYRQKKKRSLLILPGFGRWRSLIATTKSGVVSVSSVLWPLGGLLVFFFTSVVDRHVYIPYLFICVTGASLVFHLHAFRALVLLLKSFQLQVLFCVSSSSFPKYL